jgi:hypothetical protein
MKGIIDSREADWPSGLIQLVELSSVRFSSVQLVPVPCVLVPD